MKSRICRGEVVHSRLGNVRHSFRYPVYFYALELDELSTLDQSLRLFRHNRRGIVSIFDADYLDSSPGELRSKVDSTLRRAGQEFKLGRIVLLTSARFFNYVFNPVSFYYCFDDQGNLRSFIAEVNNTFGERHLYVLPVQSHPSTSPEHRALTDKDFHVSPFYDTKGTYEFRFSPPDSEVLRVSIDLIKDGQPVFKSFVMGRAEPLTNRTHLKVLARYPLTATMTMPRIIWQAAKLRFGKGLRVYTKPEPQSPWTIRKKAPGAIQRLLRRPIFSHFERIKTGALEVQLPEGGSLSFGDPRSSLRGTIQIHSEAFFKKCIFSGDIGFGESFVDGDWTSPNLTNLIRVFVENLGAANDRDVFWTKWGRQLNRWRHLNRGNTLRGSRKNISAHYDLSNDFFKLFLDPSMTYSCAVFDSAITTLEEAQRAKIDRLLSKARLSSEHHILEIGSGWGALAIRAAKTYGCRVTSITLSEEQLREARARSAAAGVDHLIKFELIDYRKMEGRFDRIISVEMLEAVGHENFDAYFSHCDRLLNNNGLFIFQSITIPDQRYEAYRQNADWIQKYIFPGGHLPSLSALSESMTRSSSLILEHLENIGPHYATTLREWRNRFKAASDQLLGMGFDPDFLRTWDYYFCYCEAAFEARALNTLQLVATRPLNMTLSY